MVNIHPLKPLIETAKGRPYVSIVMPCLNEEGTVAACVRKALGWLKRAGYAGEVVVADNGSTDRSAELAAAAGARVVSEAKRGYGAALRRGFGEARGDWIVMGDCDDTYDFSPRPRLRHGRGQPVRRRHRPGRYGLEPPLRRHACHLPSRPAFRRPPSGR
jgi:hypothetical protein